MNSDWITKNRPGFFGKRRDALFQEYTSRYGEGNWRIMWQWGDEIVPFEEACLIYEQAYYEDSIERENLWRKLTSEASEVYDHHPSNIHSGFDYSKQEEGATHLQDIAIRKVISRRGWTFEGENHIQIRGHGSFWGKSLNPGKVIFHKPDLIIYPHLDGWWNYNSIEDFYQSNKVLQVKE